MATYIRRSVPPDLTADSRVRRLGGTYLEYRPDLLRDCDNALRPETAEYLTDVSSKIARLEGLLAQQPLDYLYGALLRSEGIASSAIEGHIATARQVAVAELSGEGSVDTLAVARAVTSLRDATQELVSAPLTDEALHRLHGELLPHLQESSPGYRRVQNWISGRDILTAAYVPPAWEEIQHYMDDLLHYINTAADTPLLKAAVVHAQFESIHPYADGNGRVGRALVHTVLAQGGLVRGPVVPLSAALRTRQADYIAGLTAYRYEGGNRQAGLSEWVDEFAYCTGRAADAAEALHSRAVVIRQRWQQRIAHHRSDAAVHRALSALLQQPAVTAGSLAEQLQISKVAAGTAIRQLQDAGILTPARSKVTRAELYTADDVLDLITLTERGLASRDWDTSISAPLRHAPPLPARLARREKCDHILPRSGRQCRLAAGHRGRQHR